MAKIKMVITVEMNVEDVDLLDAANKQQRTEYSERVRKHLESDARNWRANTGRHGPAGNPNTGRA